MDAHLLELMFPLTFHRICSTLTPNYCYRVSLLAKNSSSGNSQTQTRSLPENTTNGRQDNGVAAADRTPIGDSAPSAQ